MWAIDKAKISAKLIAIKGMMAKIPIGQNGSPAVELRKNTLSSKLRLCLDLQAQNWRLLTRSRSKDALSVNHRAAIN
jgi:hypothetical protein